MASPVVTFFGVRGSTPYGNADRVGFGCNTCCVVIEIEGENPIILDMGSGLFGYAQHLADCELQATVLLTHLHWDHIAGLPFFSPVLCPGGALDVFGPPDEGMSLHEAIDKFIQPPYFPVTLADFAGDLTINDLWNAEIEASGAKVKARSVPHTSATSGYRVDIAGHSIAYLPDHQQPIDGSMAIPESVLELCDGVDLLIHDGQYPVELFKERAHWGHSTPGYAVEIARASGAASLALFSHDPLHTDEQLLEIEKGAQELGRAAGLTSVFSAREGTSITFD